VREQEETGEEMKSGSSKSLFIESLNFAAFLVHNKSIDTVYYFTSLIISRP
jgi:hypothetical protein